MMRNASAVSTAVAQLLPFRKSCDKHYALYRTVSCCASYCCLSVLTNPLIWLRGVFNNLSFDISGDMSTVINYAGGHFCLHSPGRRDAD